ncbi:Aminotransferase, class IV [Candidatus Thiomargarita nelsonii]|uniref:Aminotransferase, class IV n=1 Tax=Candidatus Thiomargarita nelsonii TaxID=1003181 RepID=A0A176S2J6_9GAMM|nr:Aminotransferase, class IV [Candidatus Thiomargarita nelsonii]
MNKLLETIKIVNGMAPFLAFHNERLNHARQILFNAHDQIDLNSFIIAPSQSEIYKCRVIYSKTIEMVEYSHYKPRHFKTFKVIEDDNIVYDFKYLNRENLNRLLRFKGQADDILIIKKGLVTDTSITNVAFLSEDKWLTPSTPLLKGTTRERFLKEKKIVEARIILEDLNNFSKMAIMNALLGFIVIENFKLG